MTLMRYANKEFNIDGYDDDNRITIGSRLIHICYLNGYTTEEMAQSFRDLNSNKPPTAHQYRQSYLTDVSEYVRTITNRIRKSTNKISKIQDDMKDDDYISKTLHYETYGTKSNKKSLDTMYMKDDMNGVKKHKKNIITWARVINHLNGKVEKSVGWNLYMFISYLHNNGVSIDKRKTKEFCEKFMKDETSRISDKITLYDKGNSGMLTWKGINGNIESNMSMRLEKIIKDFGDITEYIITKDRQRAFDFSQKISIWHRDGGMCRISENEKIYVNIVDVLNTSKWVVDHLNAHSRGGETIVENGEITTVEYNRSKSDKQTPTLA
jgi:hypothetical protein